MLVALVYPRKLSRLREISPEHPTQLPETRSRNLPCGLRLRRAPRRPLEKERGDSPPSVVLLQSSPILRLPRRLLPLLHHRPPSRRLQSSSDVLHSPRCGPAPMAPSPLRWPLLLSPPSHPLPLPHLCPSAAPRPLSENQSCCPYPKRGSMSAGHPQRVKPCYASCVSLTAHKNDRTRLPRHGGTGVSAAAGDHASPYLLRSPLTMKHSRE
jgi:hypothetical protein